MDFLWFHERKEPCLDKSSIVYAHDMYEYIRYSMLSSLGESQLGYKRFKRWHFISSLLNNSLLTDLLPRTAGAVNVQIMIT